MVDEVLDLFGVVLQGDAEAVPVAEVGQGVVVGELVLVGQRESGVVGEAVDEVGLDGVEALGGAVGRASP